MSDLKNKQEILPAQSAFVTMSEAKKCIEQTIALIPNGGTAFGITAGHITKFFITTPENRSQNSWRIAVSVEIPRFATMVSGLLATWRVPGSTRRIRFVLKGESNSSTSREEGKPDRSVHVYTMLNGKFQSQLSTEIEKAIPFKDKKVRRIYGTTFVSNDFEKILRVILSEMTDQEAFPD